MITKRKMIKFSLITLVVSILFGICCLISYAEFGIANPFSTGIALAKVMFTDMKYIEVQQYPKVIIAKPDDAKSNLVEYMKNIGFNEDESDQPEGILRFENKISAQYIRFSKNAYFSKWRWNE